ncbi:hypothetical protein [Kribbella speibonae]|nr:hypothetical protein [Kribbella speibonae]
MEDEVQAEQQRVQCICEWITMDTGNAFYSRREPNPDCPAHPIKD